MVDDILDKKSDGQLGTTFNKTLGAENGPKVLRDLLRNNLQFTEESTRLDVLLPCRSVACSMLMPQRFSTRLQRSATDRAYTFILITTSPQLGGAAKVMTATPGLETRPSM